MRPPYNSDLSCLCECSENWLSRTAYHYLYSIPVIYHYAKKDQPCNGDVVKRPFSTCLGTGAVIMGDANGGDRSVADLKMVKQHFLERLRSITRSVRVGNGESQGVPKKCSSENLRNNLISTWLSFLKPVMDSRRAWKVSNYAVFVFDPLHKIYVGIIRRNIQVVEWVHGKLLCRPIGSGLERRRGEGRLL